MPPAASTGPMLPERGHAIVPGPPGGLREAMKTGGILRLGVVPLAVGRVTRETVEGRRPTEV